MHCSGTLNRIGTINRVMRVKRIHTLQTLPVMKTGFSLRSFSLQGKTCNENRGFPADFSLQGKNISNENRFFPVKKSSQGKPCFHYRFFPVKKSPQGKLCFHYRFFPVKVCSVRMRIRKKKSKKNTV